MLEHSKDLCRLTPSALVRTERCLLSLNTMHTEEKKRRSTHSIEYIKRNTIIDRTYTHTPNIREKNKIKHNIPKDKMKQRDEKLMKKI